MQQPMGCSTCTGAISVTTMTSDVKRIVGSVLDAKSEALKRASM